MHETARRKVDEGRERAVFLSALLAGLVLACQPELPEGGGTGGVGTGGTTTTGGSHATGGVGTGGRAAGGATQTTGGRPTGGSSSAGTNTGGKGGANTGGACHESATVFRLPADFGAVPHATKGAMACGVWVITNDVVADAAVLRAQQVIQVELLKVSEDMPDVPGKLTASKSRIVIVGKNEDQSAYWPNQSGRRSWCAWPDRKGMIETTTLEEELTSGVRSTLMTTVHEMGHFTQFVLYLYKKDLYDQSVQAFQTCNQALYNSYDLQNDAEFFAGDTLRWFDLNPSDLAVSDANSLTQRAQLEKYSNVMYTIMSKVYTTTAIP